MSVAIEQAVAMNQKVKVVGSLLSNNDIVCGTGFIVSLEKLNRIVNVDWTSQQVTVQAGYAAASPPPPSSC